MDKKLDWKKVVIVFIGMGVLISIMFFSWYGVMKFINKPAETQFAGENAETIRLLNREINKLELIIETLNRSLRWEVILGNGVLSPMEKAELDAIELKLKTIIEREMGE